MSSSSIVIKVKYGETLRRFHVSLDDKKLALDIAMLTDKIRSLSSFCSDVAFTLTYVDEDGDTVTLADDEDLHDVVRQSLNPLRITVTLNNGVFSGSRGNSTPLRSIQSSSKKRKKKLVLEENGKRKKKRQDLSDVRELGHQILTSRAQYPFVGRKVKIPGMTRLYKYADEEEEAMFQDPSLVQKVNIPVRTRRYKVAGEEDDTGCQNVELDSSVSAPSSVRAGWYKLAGEKDGTGCQNVEFESSDSILGFSSTNSETNAAFNTWYLR